MTQTELEAEDLSDNISHSSRRPFFFPWAAMGVSRLGDEVFDYVLLLLSTSVYAVGLKSGVVGFLMFVPFLLLGAPIGTWLDRSKEHRISITISALLVSCLAMVGLAVTFNRIGQAWAILAYSTVFLVGTTSLIANTAVQASLPNILEDRKKIREANASLASQQSTIQIAAPLIGAQLVLFSQPTTLMILNAISFLIAALLLVPVVKGFKKLDVTSKNFKSKNSFWHDMRYGVSKMFADKLLRTPVSILSVSNMLVVGIVFSIPYIVDKYALGANALAIALSSISLGTLAGNLLAKRIGNSKTMLFSIILEPAVRAVALFILVTTMSPTALYVSMALIGLPQGYARVARVTLIHSRFPDEVRGRVVGQYMTLNRALIPFGPLAAQAITTFGGVTMLFFICSSIFAALTIALLLDPTFMHYLRKNDAF